MPETGYHKIPDALMCGQAAEARADDEGGGRRGGGVHGRHTVAEDDFRSIGPAMSRELFASGGSHGRILIRHHGFADFAARRLGDVFLIGAKDAALDGADDVMRVIVAHNRQLDARARLAMQGEADFFLRKRRGVIFVDADNHVSSAKTEVGCGAAPGQGDNLRQAGGLVESEAHADPAEALVFLGDEGLERSGLGRGIRGRCLGDGQNGDQATETGGKEQFHE